MKACSSSLSIEIAISEIKFSLSDWNLLANFLCYQFFFRLSAQTLSAWTNRSIDFKISGFSLMKTFSVQRFVSIFKQVFLISFCVFPFLQLSRFHATFPTISFMFLAMAKFSGSEESHLLFFMVVPRQFDFLQSLSFDLALDFRLLIKYFLSHLASLVGKVSFRFVLFSLKVGIRFVNVWRGKLSTEIKSLLIFFLDDWGVRWKVKQTAMEKNVSCFASKSTSTTNVDVKLSRKFRQRSQDSFSTYISICI